MTVETIRNRARQILEDTVEPYRWEDAQLRDHLQTAVRRLNRRGALALYVAYLAYFNDATDTVNNERAASCLARAEALMI